MALFKKKYSEEQIVKGCVDNDRRCQEMLYRQHFNTMYYMVKRFTRDEERALDILNAGFLKVFQKIGTFSGQGSLEGWIRRIVFHALSDHFKKEKRYLRVIVLDEAERPQSRNVLDDLYYEDLMDAVESIPGQSQEVFRLYAIEGYSHKEISTLLQIPEGTSKWHLSKARSYLREIIYQRKQAHYAG